MSHRHRTAAHTLRPRLLASVLAPLLTGPVATAAESVAVDRLAAPIVVTGDQQSWSPGPASLPEGAEIAVLEGDLAKAEHYTLRLRLPDGYQVPPHSHPVREHITVLEGRLMMGMGDTFDESAMRGLGEGSLFVLPVGDTHFVRADGETVVQLHGVGPWGIRYVNPADDPRQRD